MVGALLSAAFVLDLIFGDPRNRFHPIRLIGILIDYLEKLLYRQGTNLFLRGVFLTTIAITIPCLINTIVYKLLSVISTYLSMLWCLFLTCMFIALKDLVKHVRSVTERLSEGDIVGARKSLSYIVGRDTKHLDEFQIKRALVETISENFVDGILSPVFWFFVGVVVARIFGLDEFLWAINFMILYKATNTCDSMVGYRNERYESFGKFSARLDDALNFLPARLSILFLALGAHSCSLDLKRALKVAKRDRLKHQSPNSAHAESFVAGALGISLGGPTSYGGFIKERPWIGEGPPEFGMEKVEGAILLIVVSSVLLIAVLSASLWLITWSD